MEMRMEAKTERIASALERIADALEKQNVGVDFKKLAVEMDGREFGRLVRNSEVRILDENSEVE